MGGNESSFFLPAQLQTGAQDPQARQRQAVLRDGAGIERISEQEQAVLRQVPQSRPGGGVRRKECFVLKSAPETDSLRPAGIYLPSFIPARSIPAFLFSAFFILFSKLYICYNVT